MADTAPIISLPPDFRIAPQDGRLKHQSPKSPSKVTDPPLGVVEHFTGTFAGTGFNLIFRPNSGQTTFPVPVNPPAPTPPNENVLELNLTTETLSFSPALGNVPNRGLEQQTDIFLNGVPYVQAISDVSNIDTGKGDAKTASAIHFEPGLWMHVPETTIDPVLGESLTRMASIPHGTTINAQCLAPTTSFPGPPPFTGANALDKVDITPFVIGNIGQRVPFASQKVDAKDTARLPQDLTNFINAGTITQEILDNPNIVLANAIAGQKITNTIVFTVSTSPTVPFLAGGTANIDFLQGSSAGVQSGPNASAVEMFATFWIETVQFDIPVPIWKHGDPPLKKVQVPPASPTGQPGPLFALHPPHDITTPTTVTFQYTQIQYMQTVFLNFAGLTWPHVSCATLTPSKPIRVPASAFK
ncbi:MAG: hypothetical protein M1814_004957 [Vezdaea aestivalis]|nr:MAG: hypothetical protein M1814_004957 [Vezdaea aestivalis]